VSAVAVAPPLVPGHVYTWDELGDLFSFGASYLSAAGGMISRPATTSSGAVSELEPSGSSARRGLSGMGPRGVGGDAAERDIIRYRLVFETGGRPAVPTGGEVEGARSNAPDRAPAHRSRRPFDPSRQARAHAAPTSRATAEEIAALQEKANREHHALLSSLAAQLAGRGWDRIFEIPGPLDLEAVRSGRRVLFEAKILSGTNELSQVRAALASFSNTGTSTASPTMRSVSSRTLRSQTGALGSSRTKRSPSSTTRAPGSLPRGHSPRHSWTRDSVNEPATPR
jgi:hypothetical protein